MTDQLALLPRFSWRGNEYPIAERNVSFAHESVQHKLQRRNRDLIEQTGAHNLVFTYSIPMREDLHFGPWRNKRLFTEYLQVLLDDFRNKEPGDLFDPIYGLVVCVPGSWDDTTDVNKRDGTDLKLEFTQAPEAGDDDIALAPTASAVDGESSDLEVAAQELEQTLNEADEIDAVTSIKLTDLLGEVSAFGRGALNLPNEALSEMNKIVYWAEELEDIVSDASAPDIEAVRVRARSLRDRANRVIENQAELRPVRTSLLTSAKSITTLAAEFGVSVAALLRANKKLALSPVVRPGTLVVIPDGAS